MDLSVQFSLMTYIIDLSAVSGVQHNDIVNKYKNDQND